MLLRIWCIEERSACPQHDWIRDCLEVQKRGVVLMLPIIETCYLYSDLIQFVVDGFSNKCGTVKSTRN